MLDGSMCTRRNVCLGVAGKEVKTCPLSASFSERLQTKGDCARRITKGCFRLRQSEGSSINLASSPSPIAYSRPHIADCWTTIASPRPGPNRRDVVLRTTSPVLPLQGRTYLISNQLKIQSLYLDNMRMFSLITRVTKNMQIHIFRKNFVFW